MAANRIYSKKAFFSIFLSVLMPLLLLSVLISDPASSDAAGGCAPSIYWYKTGADAYWTTLAGNWWTDEAHTSQASALPASGACVGTVPDSEIPIVVVDDVPEVSTLAGIDATATGIIFTSSDGASFPNIHYEIQGDVTLKGSVVLQGELHAAGTITFDGTSVNQGSPDRNSLVFSGASHNEANFPGGSGTFTFNGSSYNTGFLDAAFVTFNGSSHSDGGIFGSITFNGSSYTTNQIAGGSHTILNTDHYGGVVPIGGVLTLNGNQNWWATEGGNAYDSNDQLITSFIFNGSSYLHQDSQVSGDAVFNDSSHIDGSVSGNAKMNTDYYGGVVPTGGVITLNGTQVWNAPVTMITDSNDEPITSIIFNESSYNAGTVNAMAAFNGSAYNAGYIYGTSTFNGVSFNGAGGTPGSVAIFNASSSNRSDVMGEATFNDSAYNTGNLYNTATFNASSSNLYGASIYSPATFNGTSYNEGYIEALTTFNASSSNAGGGIINGDAEFHGVSYNGGSVTGSATFNDSTYNIFNVAVLATFNDFSHNDAATDFPADAIFNDSSFNQTNAVVYGHATFNDLSYNLGTIDSDATFNTAYYGGVLPAGGLFTIGGGKSWYGSVGNIAFGSDDATITAFAFMGTSTNEGTVFATVPANATTTFYEDLSENHGIVNGTKVRRYTSNATTTRNFITSGPWTVIADGATVDLSGSSFNATTTFRTLNGGAFGVLSTACAAPLPGTLSYVLSGDISGSCTVASSDVTIDGNDHAISGNVIANGIASGASGFNLNLARVTVGGTVSSNGANGTIGGSGGTITISSSTVAAVRANGGNGTGNGGNGGIIALVDSTSTALSANGGNSSNNGAGGSGGTISLENSTSTSISVSAGTDGPNKNPAQDSGHGGTSHATDTAPPVITLNGSSAVSIAFGGTYVELGATAVDAVSGSRTVVISGSVNTAVAGVYVKTYTAADAAGNSASKTRTITVRAQATAANTNPPGGAATPAHASSRSSGSAAMLPTLNLAPLPSFSNSVSNNLGVSHLGNPLEGLKAFSSLKLSTLSFKFVPQISTFVFAPLPASVAKILGRSPKLSNLVASVGVSREQDLVALLRNPILIPKPAAGDIPPGLFIATASSTPLELYLAGDAEHRLAELVRTQPGTVLDIAFVPLSKSSVQAKFRGSPIKFFASRTAEVHAVIAAPDVPGRYFMTTSAAPFPLIIEVVALKQQSAPAKPEAKGKFGSWLSGLFH
ncbi:MAG: hypothetical protein JWO73_292 [Candidatus Taylorbacteria bacterium]|nr:hypothetical protein [Candidatus Taylorbacteria bacterium]